MTGTKKDFSIRDEESIIRKYPEYQRYIIQKNEIKAKYPEELFLQGTQSGRRKIKYSIEERDLYKQYLKELGDLLFQPDGDFQQFTWEMLSDADKLEQERKARGRQRRLVDY